jgi:hypothetical protein
MVFRRCCHHATPCGPAQAHLNQQQTRRIWRSVEVTCGIVHSVQVV